MQLDELLDGYTYPWLTVSVAAVVAVIISLIIHAVRGRYCRAVLHN